MSNRHHPDRLLQEADMALFRAKEGGRDRAELYDRTLGVQAFQRVETEDLIRNALDRDLIVLHYQPVIDLGSGEVVGTEALARIRRPGGRLLPPARFISVAEDSGLIVALGSVVLRQACAQQARWARQGCEQHIAVNVSGRQLASEHFVGEVASALAGSGMDPDLLCLELTESTLIDASPATRSRISQLKDLGVTLALDDFGTGWSSLAYLRRFPIDLLKIDRSFVSGLGQVKDDAEVVKAVIGLGRSLGLRIVAEGVETATQEAILAEMGCDFAQGYLYGRPVPARRTAPQRDSPTSPLETMALQLTRGSTTSASIP